MIRVTAILLVLFCLSTKLSANDIVLNARAATALNQVTLYPDSSFIKHSSTFLPAGTLFEVMGETRLEHEDAAQNQKFKWYRVRTKDKQQGWIFGDGIAVVVPKERLNPTLKNFHKQKVHFNNGFENAVIWMASVVGRDNFHKEDYLNPPYEESYIVVTNESGNSVYIDYGGITAVGKKELYQLQLYDTTGDGFDEFLLQTSTYAMNQSLENRNFEIYSFQAGTLEKVFEERMTLNYEDDLPSPALFKFIEIDKDLIRIAYVDYLPCKDYSLSFSYDELKKQSERCLEYITYTYQWADQLKKYKTLYSKSRVCPLAGSLEDGAELKDEPSIVGNKIAAVNRNEQLQVIKHYER